MNTQDDNNDIQILKKELQIKRTIVETTVLQRKEARENSSLLEDIQRNNIREREMTQELKKENSLVWKDNKIVYMDRQIYIPNNKKL